MGRILENASRAGTCPACKKSWNPGEKIFWDNKVKNSANFAVTCTDEECFKKQGGMITPFAPKQFGSKSNVDVTAKIHDANVNSQKLKDLEEASETVLAAFKIADKLVGNIYPNLPASDQTYGMIRSKFVDWIISVDNNS